MSHPVTTSDLLAIARQVEPSINERTLEYWRNRRLLPSPERVAQQGRRPIRVYPAGTDGWLRSLLAWRATSPRDLDAVRVALWTDGYPITLEDVRVSGVAVLDRTLARIARNLEPYGGYHPDDPGRTAAAVEAHARKQAARRGRHATGHEVRMRLSERADAKAYATRVVLGLEDGKDPEPDLAQAVRKDLGLPERGVPAATRNLLGLLPIGLREFAQAGSIPALKEAYLTAADEMFSWPRISTRLTIGGFAAIKKGIQDALAMGPRFMADFEPPRAADVVVLVGFSLSIALAWREFLPEEPGQWDAEARSFDAMSDEELAVTIKDQTQQFIQSLPKAPGRRHPHVEVDFAKQEAPAAASTARGHGIRRIGPDAEGTYRTTCSD